MTPSTTSKRNRNSPKAARARVRRGRNPRRATRTGLATWLVLGVIVVIAVALIVATVAGRDDGSSASTRSLAPASLVRQVTSVPDGVANQVGSGSASLPVALHAPAVTSDGKPVVTYLGAEYCPFCAGERWAMVLALSRFGTFTDLGTTHSASEDVHPDTPTFTFHGSTYSSPYVEFQPVEMQTNQLAGSTYATLDTPTAAQQKLIDTYDAQPYFPSNGAIPFVDFAGKYGLSGASYDVSVLDGKSYTEIADALHDPTSPIAKGIVGTANAMTAAICAATGDQPASACSIPAVQALRAKLP